ncbi:hypothetical protein MSAN_00195100 [Mycena sanguinolenta]|uniref:Uncharacterized protein n=1 Tax=Mycena sanguinolenta TaxID=230812 RepID=A0A8H6ZJV3_9AGAR|nr:hypothetical protein MSAN_00195100 [Mycena sanguinolenta]
MGLSVARVLGVATRVLASKGGLSRVAEKVGERPLRNATSCLQPFRYLHTSYPGHNCSLIRPTFAPLLRQSYFRRLASEAAPGRGRVVVELPQIVHDFMKWSANEILFGSPTAGRPSEIPEVVREYIKWAEEESPRLADRTAFFHLIAALYAKKTHWPPGTTFEKELEAIRARATSDDELNLYRRACVHMMIEFEEAEDPRAS